VWLCRPGQASNPCALSLDTSVVAADGAVTVERAPPAAAPPIDCFYVYPTVSAQGEVNADRSVDPELVDIAEAQAARFSSVCRVFAPVYRQVTVVGLISPSAAAGFELAYADVRDAWADYLARDNQGRGVVLIGHSQGAGLLTRLVCERIDGDPAARAKLVSALILGSAVRVPEGANVGGDFATSATLRAVPRESTEHHLCEASAGRWGDGLDDGGRWMPYPPDGAWVEAVGREVCFGSRVADEAERARVRAFCASLPLALERPDLRVVHAAWREEAAAALPPDGDLADLDAHFDAGVRAGLDAAGLHAAAAAERAQWAGLRKRPVEPPAMLAAVQAVDLAEQNDNPVKVLTSGLEEPIAAGSRYYVGGKWRYVQRSRWWRASPPDRPTVVGHYWRSRVARPPGLADVWDGVDPFAWEGDTFCVDYSVGRRYAERARGPVGAEGFRAGLAAMLWPEAALCFDDRDALVPTEGLNAPGQAAGAGLRG
jgi:hypothetical protein